MRIYLMKAKDSGITKLVLSFVMEFVAVHKITSHPSMTKPISPFSDRTIAISDNASNTTNEEV